ncbi:MAG TPA: hypothetical protein VF746_26585 [Longimicrobium sp.]|jgi:hypothetical protein
MSSRVDRLLRWVWLINGILLLALLAIGTLFVLGAWITDLAAGDPAVPAAPKGGASGPERPRAVRYDAPAPIRGSDARIVLVGHGQGYRPAAGERGMDSGDGTSEGPIVNVAFLDGRGGRLLLDRPAYVAEVRWPGDERAGPDSTLRWIVYEMALEDGNGDGRLDHRDPLGLYVSDLAGGGLRPVLPRGFRLRGWEPRADGTLFITALPQPARGADPDQLPQRSFLVGPDGQARPYAALDSLAEAAGRILRK